MSLRLATAFHFYLNPNLGLLSREHRKRGTHTLQEQHRQDLMGLCQVIHNDLTLMAFFPNLSNRPKEQAAAWMWMGSQYLSLGSKIYADEAFNNALKPCQTTGQRIFTKVRIIFLRLAKAILSDRVRMQLRAAIDNLQMFFGSKIGSIF
jgi:hypothetical protein